MNRSGKNPFMLIIICMALLLLTQTITAFAVVFMNGGALFTDGMTMAEADAVMLEVMFEKQTQILLISYLMVLAGLWLMAHRTGEGFFTFTGLAAKPGVALMILAVIAGIAASFWATIAVNLIPWPEAWTENYQIQSGSLQSAQPLIDLVAVGFLAPLTEELLFRGVIYRAFCVILPAGFAVIFQGMLFGSVHSTIIWMTYAFFMGCILGYVRKQTGSTRPCILMHMAFNLSSYLFSWFAESYGEDPAAIGITFVISALLLLLCMYGINYRSNRSQEESL